MNGLFRQNQVIIDLGAIRHNYLLMKSRVGEGVRVMAVVKANAYGHGIVEVARTIEATGGGDLAVAIAEEGIQLREAGLRANILVLGAATEVAVDAAIAHGLTQTIFEPRMVAVLEEAAARLGKTAYVHIKLDTGMNRIGLRTGGEADALAVALAQAPHICVTGIYTHFADADNLPQGTVSTYTQRQLEAFRALRAHFDPSIPAHASNSAMSLVSPEADFAMIREGISLYGYPPVPTDLPFLPALRWVAEVVNVKDIAAGECVGYGCTFTANRPTRIATVAVGYGDGYHRAASNRGQMLVGGRRANIVGRICMDQTMIDVTDIDGVAVGSQVVLIGAQGALRIGADEVAAWAGTISYEVLLAVTTRVPRAYLPVGEA
jgi:alanine racemase